VCVQLLIMIVDGIFCVFGTCMFTSNIGQEEQRGCSGRKQYTVHSLFMTYHTSARNREKEG